MKWSVRRTLFTVVFGLAISACQALADEMPPIPATDEKAAGCPLHFDSDTVCLPRTCLFVGRYNGSCGEPAVAVFAGDGQYLVVGLAFSQTGAPTYLAGSVASQTSATLAAWQPSLDVPAARMEPGSATLEQGGQVLRVQLDQAPFQIDGCQFGEFVGQFVQMIDAEQGIPAPPRQQMALAD